MDLSPESQTAAHAAHHTRLPTAEVNRVFEQALLRRRPPAEQGRPWKLYYATQVGAAPPTFMLFANRALRRADPYRRYLVHRLPAVEMPEGSSAGCERDDTNQGEDT